MSEAKKRWWKRLPSVQGVITLGVVLAVSFIAFSVGRVVGPGEGAGEEEGEGESLQGGVEGEDPASEEEVEYVCPMHPQIRQPEFGTCPICLMDLVPVAVESGGDFIALQPSHAAIQLANVRIEEVGRVPLTEHIDVFGRVATAGDGAAEITAWAGGRIERLYVEVEGEEVQRGQRLARIYSPELVVAQETLLHSERILREAESTGSDTRRRTAQAAYDAARTELRLLGFDDDDIDELVEDGEADEYVTLRAPASGTIMERHIAEGDYVQPGTRILSLADLDEVWIQLEIFERDLPFVNVGDTVHLRAGEAEGEATISFIDPMIDPVRRVARARVVVPNDGTLRPDLFVEGHIAREIVDDRGRPPVSVPVSSVLWTGPRSIVYVYDPVTSPPTYMPVEVEIGPRVGDRVVIESGVFPGERVVTNGAFRLDASLQIQGGNSMMNPGEEPPSSSGGHDHAH